jgi:hypothetical protein
MEHSVNVPPTGQAGVPRSDMSNARQPKKLACRLSVARSQGQSRAPTRRTPPMRPTARVVRRAPDPKAASTAETPPAARSLRRAPRTEAVSVVSGLPEARSMPAEERTARVAEALYPTTPRPKQAVTVCLPSWVTAVRRPGRSSQAGRSEFAPVPPAAGRHPWASVVPSRSVV